MHYSSIFSNIFNPFFFRNPIPTPTLMKSSGLSVVLITKMDLSIRGYAHDVVPVTKRKRRMALMAQKIAKSDK